MNITKIKEKMLTALRLKEEIQSILKKYGASSDYDENGINPFYHQTVEESEGFVCEYYYGVPSKIYTPLGSLNIWTSFMSAGQNEDKIVKEIEDTFGFVLQEEGYINSMGFMGGWYHITKLPWNNIELKCDCVKRNTEDYMEYKVAKKMYEEVLETFKQGRDKE